MTVKEKLKILGVCKDCLRLNECELSPDDEKGCALKMTEKDAKIILLKSVDAIRFLGKDYGDLGFMEERDQSAYWRCAKKPKGKIIATESGETRDQDVWTNSVYFLKFEDFLEEIGIRINKEK
jgi:hypothetical protein